MARKFVYDDREFPDIDPNRTVDEIRQRMADHFPVSRVNHSCRFIVD